MHLKKIEWNISFLWHGKNFVMNKIKLSRTLKNKDNKYEYEISKIKKKSKPSSLKQGEG